MSTFYDVTLLKRKGGEVELLVEIGSEEAEPFEPDKAFALQLLTSNPDSTALRAALPGDCALGADPDVAGEFLAEVRLERVHNRDWAGFLGNLRYAIPPFRPRAVFHIVVKDQALLEGFLRGQRWDSAAYCVPALELPIRQAAGGAKPLDVEVTVTGASPMSHGRRTWKLLELEVPGNAAASLQALGSPLHFAFRGLDASVPVELIDADTDPALVLLHIEPADLLDDATLEELCARPGPARFSPQAQ